VPATSQPLAHVPSWQIRPVAHVVPSATLLQEEALRLGWQLAQAFVGSGAPLA
jgi:hypothetical protein